MGDRIYRELGPVRRRQESLLAVKALTWGLLASAVIACGLGAWRLAFAATLPWASVLGIVAAGPMVALIFTFAFRQGGWHQAAEAVDAHYHLKDRSITALEFLTKPLDPVMKSLQIEDAERHLAAIVPAQVVPWRIPRVVPVAATAVVLAGLLLLWPTAAKTLKAGAEPALPQIVAEAEKIEEDLKELDSLAKKEKDKDLEKVLKEMADKVMELKQPGVDVKEALAKLSEMQAALAAEQAKYNPALVDAQLQSLGEAISAAESMQDAAQALQNGEHQKAAEKLEELDPTDVDRKEAKTIKDRLKKLAKQMKESGMGQLGEATDSLGEGLESDGQVAKDSAKKIAGICKSQAKRKSIFNSLCLECNKLSECKSNCNKNSLAKGKAPKSDKPSQTFGLKTNGELYGEKRELGARRDRKDITGQMGQGPSETETTHSPEGREVASAKYRESYQKYKKMTESVLDSEPIPLGHRQTIRKYFELIRPSNDEADGVMAPKTSGGTK